MSDLISRSKVISVLEKLEEHSLNGKMDISNAIYLLNNQPTAYDIDRVVKELEKEAERWEDSGKEYKDKCEIAVGRGLRNSIEIVKQGGVADDVCEWRIVDRPNNLPIYNTSCGKIRLQYVTGVDIYCNGCGKKIKVVE